MATYQVLVHPPTLSGTLNEQQAHELYRLLHSVLHGPRRRDTEVTIEEDSALIIIRGERL